MLKPKLKNINYFLNFIQVVPGSLKILNIAFETWLSHDEGVDVWLVNYEKVRTMFCRRFSIIWWSKLCTVQVVIKIVGIILNLAVINYLVIYLFWCNLIICVFFLNQFVFMLVLDKGSEMFVWVFLGVFWIRWNAREFVGSSDWFEAKLCGFSLNWLYFHF